MEIAGKHYSEEFILALAQSLFVKSTDEVLKKWLGLEYQQMERDICIEKIVQLLIEGMGPEKHFMGGRAIIDELECVNLNSLANQRNNEFDHLTMTRAFQEMTKFGGFNKVFQASTAIVGIVKKDRWNAIQNGHAETVAHVLSRMYNAADYLGVFADEPVHFRGTGFLISNRRLLTAFHNLPFKDGGVDFENLVFVWRKRFPDFQLANGYVELRGKSVVAGEGFYEDWALVELETPLTEAHFMPLTLAETDTFPDGKQPFFSLGHSFGTELKASLYGKFLCVDSDYAFLSSLDLFQGNSGSPIIGWEDGFVYGILSGGLLDVIKGEDSVLRMKRYYLDDLLNAIRKKGEECQSIHLIRPQIQPYLNDKYLLNTINTTEMSGNYPYTYIHHIGSGEFVMSVIIDAGNNYLINDKLAPGNNPQFITFSKSGAGSFAVPDTYSFGVEDFSHYIDCNTWVTDNPPKPKEKNTQRFLAGDYSNAQGNYAIPQYAPHVYLYKTSSGYFLKFAIAIGVGKSFSVGESTNGNGEKVFTLTEVNNQAQTMAIWKGSKDNFQMAEKDLIHIEVRDTNNLLKGGGKVRHTLADPKPFPWDED